MTPARILVTGSREWTDRKTIATYLKFEYHMYFSNRDTVLVHGACPTGADAIADEIWTKQGLPVERHPADWSLGKKAGYLRNKRMVDLGANVCLAFILNESPGATMCAGLAKEAGIPTHYIRIDEQIA